MCTDRKIITDIWMKVLPRAGTKEQATGLSKIMTRDKPPLFSIFVGEVQDTGVPFTYGNPCLHAAWLRRPLANSVEVVVVT